MTVFQTPLDLGNGILDHEEHLQTYIEPNFSSASSTMSSRELEPTEILSGIASPQRSFGSAPQDQGSNIARSVPLPNSPVANPTNPNDLAQILQQLGITMSNSLADAVVHLQSQGRTGASTHDSGDKEPKANDPSTFDGTSRKSLEIFIAENEIMFATAPRKYRSEIQKVLAAGSFLKGDPKKWFSNYFLLSEMDRPLWFHSWIGFKEELRRCWGLEDPEGAAETELRKLSMSDKDHVSYFTSKFRAIQHRLPNWADRNLRNTYYSALAPRIRHQFVTAGRIPPSQLDGLIAAAESFDRAYWTDYELNQRNNSNDKKSDKKKSDNSADNNNSDQSQGSNSKSSKKKKKKSGDGQQNSNNSKSSETSKSQSKSGSSEPAYKKLLGADGKLLPKERERRIANGLCLLCGQKEHMASDCPKRKVHGNYADLSKSTINLTPPPNNSGEEKTSK